MRRHPVSFFLVFLLLIITLIPASAFIVPLVKAQNQPSYNVIEPDREPIDVTVAGDGKTFDVDTSNGLRWTFQTGANKYNGIYENSVQIVKDERWLLVNEENNNNPRATGITWEQIDSYHVIVTQFYTSKTGDYNVTWNFREYLRPKITLTANIVTAENHTINWRTNIYKDYALNMSNYLQFWDAEEEPILCDYNDVYNNFGNITSFSIEGWTKGKQLDIIFDVGFLDGNFTLDPSIGYTEGMESWSQAYDLGWQSYDIFTNHGVPKGAVVEIIATNSLTGYSASVGVGDSAFLLHEAEGGGLVTARFLTTVDVDTGLITVRNSNPDYANNTFFIVGYWTDVTFTETWIAGLVAPSRNDENTWLDFDLFTSDGIPKGSVCLVSLVNSASGNEYEIGVRTDGSSLQRVVDIHEAESNAKNVVSMFVKTSEADGIIEGWFEDEEPDCEVIIQGYFGADIDFQELMTSKDQTSGGSWEEFDLTGDLDEDGRVTDFLLTNNDPDAEHTIGARIEGSVLPRYVLEHEAEGGGVTGFGMSVKSDASGVVELYCDNSDFDTFYLTGYFIFTTDEGTTENLYGVISSTITVVGGKFVSYSTYCDVAPLVTIGTQIASSFDRYGNISSVTTIAYSSSVSITNYRSVSASYAVFSSNVWSFSQEGTVYQLSSVDGWLETLVGLEVFGDVQPLLIVDAELSFAIVKLGDLEVVCAVTHSQTKAFNVYLDVSPLFVIAGTYIPTEETIENLYGVINQVLGVESFNLYIFDSSGDITQTIVIATAKDMTVDQVMTILSQMGLSHIRLEDLIRAGVVNKQFTLNSLTIKTLTEIGVINEDLTINDYSLTDLVRLGVINENVLINNINLKALTRTGLVSETFTLDSAYSSFIDLLFYGVVNLDYTIDSETFTELLRLGLVNEAVTINSIDFETLTRLGEVNPQFTFDGVLLSTLLKVGAINHDLSIDSSTLEQFIKYGVVSETLLIDGSYSTFGELLLSGAINLDLTIDAITYEELVRLGLINETFSVSSIDLETFLKYGVINEQITIDTLSLNSLLKLGAVNQDFVINTELLTQLVRLGIINEQFSIDTLTLQEMIRVGIISEAFTINEDMLYQMQKDGILDATFNINGLTLKQLIQYGVIDETLVINGEYTTFRDLVLIGAINLDLTIDSITYEELVKLGLINEDFNINDLTLYDLIKAGYINETFTLGSLTLKDLVSTGIINLDATINSQTLEDLIRLGIISETFTVNDLTLNDLIKAGIINEDLTLNDVELWDLIKAGIINEDILIDEEKTMSFNLFGGVTQTIGITSIFDYFSGVIEWIYGSIAAIIAIATSASGVPTIITQYIPIGRGLIFFAVIVSGATVTFLYNNKKKQKDSP